MSQSSYLAVEQIVCREVTTCINYSTSPVLKDINSQYLRCEICNTSWEVRAFHLFGKCVVCSKITSQWKWKPYHLANWQQSSEWNPGLTMTQCSLPYTLQIVLLLFCNQRLVLLVCFIYPTSTKYRPYYTY